MSQPEASSRDRLLTAAKQLFLEKGADQVSLRSVNTAAGLNPGAVHYHFGSREGLVSALLERELRPMWSGRLGALSGPPGGDLQVRDLVAALVEPFAELVGTRDGRVLCHLLARAALPTGQVLNVSTLFAPAPFEVLLGRALPELSPQEVTERCRPRLQPGDGDLRAPAGQDARGALVLPAHGDGDRVSRRRTDRTLVPRRGHRRGVTVHPR